MKRTIPLFLWVTLIACADNTSGFSNVDKETINQIRRDYVNGWLANESETVLELFAEDAVIIPSGLSPIRGLAEMERYWFPNDSSLTTIHSYEIELLELSGTDSMAFSLERGTFNFTYTKGDFTMTKESSSHATTIYKLNDHGNWKIVSRMWSNLNQ